MQFLNEINARRFNLILSLLDGKNYCKIDNAPGAYMALHVELVGEYADSAFGDGKVYSLAHYYKQCGDMMADPEMEFWVDTAGRIAPLTVRIAAMGYYRTEASLIYGSVNVKGQRDLRDFSQMWLLNVCDQQELTLTPVNS